MRILHVTDVYRPRVGGIEMFVEELAERQSAALQISCTRRAAGAVAGSLDLKNRGGGMDLSRMLPELVARRPSRTAMVVSRAGFEPAAY